MTFSREEIREDFRAKTKRVPTGTGGSITEDMCDRTKPKVFTQTRIEESFNSLADAPVVFMRRRVEKIQEDQEVDDAADANSEDTEAATETTNLQV